MRPLNYAILKLFAGGREHDVEGAMGELRGEYAHFRAFKPAAVNESLMSAEQNGLLEAVRYALDDAGSLHVYYKATEYGEEMIAKYL